MKTKERKIKRHNLAFLAREVGKSRSRYRRLTSGRGVKGRKISIDQAAAMPAEQLKAMFSYQ